MNIGTVLELLKKYAWVVKLAFTALLATQLAMLVNTRVEAKLGDVQVVDVDHVKVAQAAAFTSISEYDPILEKNVFNSDYVWVKSDGPSSTESRPEDYELLGTVAWNDTFSMAIIRSRTANKDDVYRVNDPLGDDAEVKDIERKRVTIERDDGRIEVLELPEAVLPLQMASNSPMFERGVDVGEGGIKKVGDGAYVVDKGVIEDAFSNWGNVMRGARIVPHFDRGKISGFKIKRIKSNSIYKKLGMEDGDIIHRINGKEITGPDDAFQLMAELKNANRLSMDITRKGERRSFSYDVR